MTSPTTKPLDPTRWGRIGGHRFDFYATHREVQDWLIETLPADQGPFLMVGVDRPSLTEWRWFSFAPETLTENLLAPNGEPRINLYIWTPTSMPDLTEVFAGPATSMSENFLHVNGLLVLQPARPRRGPMGEGQSESSLAVMPRQVDREGTEIYFGDSKRLFDRMKRLMRARFERWALWITPGGAEGETKIGMSTGIVAAFEAGLRLYQVRPGPSVRPRTGPEK